MDDERRFDALVGLIYDSAHSGLGPIAVVDAINSELGALGAQLAPEEDSQRQMLVAFVSQLAELDTPSSSADESIFDSLGTASALQELDDFNRGASAERLLRRLTPHLARSASLRKRLQQLESQKAIRDVELAWLPFGMVWVGADLTVLSTNARADTLLRARDGLTVEAQRLRASMATDAERLDRALMAALDPVQRQSRLMALRRQGASPPLLLSVIPATTTPVPGSTAIGPVALVILQNPGDAAINLEHLQAIYGFTTTERKLAEALLNNETLESYAEMAQVTRHTARTHLAHLFTKTGTSRQAELVRLLMLAQPRT